MAKGDTMAEHGRLERQKILDYLNASGPATSPRIAEATQRSRVSTASRIARMRHQDEVEAEERVVGGRLCLFYRALVRVTLSKYPAEGTAVMRDKASLAVKRTNHRAPVVSQGPWHTVHRCSETDPTPHPKQGGQGTIGLSPRGSSVLEGIF